MARRDERGYSEYESDRYQSEKFRSQGLGRSSIKIHARNLRNENESESSNHGRDSSRSHSSDNSYRRGQWKDSQLHSQSTSYLSSGRTGDQIPLRGSSQLRVVEKHYHTPQEVTQLNRLPLEKSSFEGPSLDRHRNREKEGGRLGVVTPRKYQDQTQRARGDDPGPRKDVRTEDSLGRQVRGRMEGSDSRKFALNTSTRGYTRDDSRNPRSRSPKSADKLGQYRSRNNLIAKTTQPTYSTPGTHPQSSQDHYPTYSRYHLPSASTQPGFTTLDSSRQFQSPPRLELVASGLHRGSSDPPISAAPERLSNENDAITPISTSAMSISSGSTPSQSSSSRKGSMHRKVNACIMCKKPEAPLIDLLVRCNHCHTYYHTSCHNPKITRTNGCVNVDVQTWKCQRCTRNSNQASDTSNSLGKSSHSTAVSEPSSIASDIATQISRAITGLSLDTVESECMGPESPWVDQHCSSHAQSSTGNSEELDVNLIGQDIDPHYAGGPLVSDVEHPRKRFKCNISDSDHHHTVVPTRVASGHNKMRSAQQNLWNGNLRSAATSISRLEQDRQYEEFSRSPSIFSENRTIAVVIDNRSRSTSTSTNDKRVQDANDWSHTPTTVEDSQETPELVLRARYAPSSRKRPPQIPYQESQPIITDSDEDDLPSPPPPLLLEVKNSQEVEEELTDAPMSLDSTEIHSPAQQEYNISNRMNLASPVREHSETYWRSEGEGGGGDEEREGEGAKLLANLGVPLASRSEMPPGQESPQYAPSVGDPYGKAANGQHINQGHSVMSSPPYSPPPPDIPDTIPEPVDTSESYVSLPPTIQDNRQTSIEYFICRKCRFRTVDNGQYKDEICGSCVIKTTLRHNTYQTTDPLALNPKTSKETATAKYSPASTPHLLGHRHRGSSSSKTTSSQIPESPHLSITSKVDEAPKRTNHRGDLPTEPEPPVKKFQTSKDRVIERYQMKLTGPPEPIQRAANAKTWVNTATNKRKREEPVKPAPVLHISARESLDKKGKGKAVAINGKPGRSGVLVGAARKFPSKPGPLDISPPMKSSRNTSVDRPVIRESSVSSRKAERRGPAMKSAGRPVQLIPNSDDDFDEEEDIQDRYKELEKKFQEQKGYTKKQMERAVELQKKLMESEREKAEIQERLEAALSANQKSADSNSPKQARRVKKLKRLVQLHRNDETQANDQSIQLISRDRASEPKGPSLKELYKDYKFIADVPWLCPPEIPTPDSNTFRGGGWRNRSDRPRYDLTRKMNVHLHRELTRSRSPLKIMAEPDLDADSSHLENSRSSSLDGEPSENFFWPRGGRPTTIDEFMGFPDNMVPAVKDGVLGFRPGIINQRTRCLDRSVQHYRIRAPGDFGGRI